MPPASSLRALTVPPPPPRAWPQTPFPKAKVADPDPHPLPTFYGVGSLGRSFTWGPVSHW